MVRASAGSARHWCISLARTQTNFSGDLVLMDIQYPSWKEWEQPLQKGVFVLDPNLRKYLFPQMPQEVRGWGFDSTVYSAENPGDVLVYRVR